MVGVPHRPHLPSLPTHPAGCAELRGGAEVDPASGLPMLRTGVRRAGGGAEQREKGFALGGDFTQPRPLEVSGALTVSQIGSEAPSAPLAGIGGLVAPSIPNPHPAGGAELRGGAGGGGSSDISQHPLSNELGTTRPVKARFRPCPGHNMALTGLLCSTSLSSGVRKQGALNYAVGRAEVDPASGLPMLEGRVSFKQWGSTPPPTLLQYYQA